MVNEKNLTTRKPILCLDFDGVCHSYTSAWQGATTIADGPVKGLEGFLYKAQVYFEVHIFSSRSNQVGGIAAMKAWFGKHCRKSVTDNLVFPLRKPPAHLTIDDRAICFNGTWPEMTDMVHFTPWNKKERMK